MAIVTNTQTYTGSQISDVRHCAVGARFASPGTELKNAGSVASPEISQIPSPKYGKSRENESHGSRAWAKGLRDRTSPMCTLSQNGCGAILSSRKKDPALRPVHMFTHQPLTPNAPVFLFTHQPLMPNAPPPSPAFPTGNKTFPDCAILLGECSCAIGARFASPGTN